MSKALELADAYADAASTHRLESLYGTSKSYTLLKANERDAAHEALATELRRLAAVEAERDALLEALQKIAAIENKEWGTDWEEIDEARDIARTAITKSTGETK